MSAVRQPPAIEAFGAGGFRVGGARIEGSVLILDDQARPWAPTELAQVSPADLEAVIAAGKEAVEFMLLGVGPRVVPPPRAVRERMAAAGLGLEVMSTAEACRLYNVLSSDGRRIAAALIAI